MSERTPPSKPDLGTLAIAAFRTAVTRQPVAWGAWGALLAFSIGLDFVARRAGVPLDRAALDAGFVTYTVIDAAATALVSGVALFAYLTGRAPARLGGGYFSFAGLVAGAELLWLCVFLFGVPRETPGANPDPAMAGRAAAMLGLVILGGFASIRLLLWPIGRLMGQAPATPAQSWRAMRGMVGTYIGASILVALPIVMLTLAVSGLSQGAPDPVAMVLLRILDVALTAAATALSAEIWRRRAPAPERAMAEVFD